MKTGLENIDAINDCAARLDALGLMIQRLSPEKGDWETIAYPLGQMIMECSNKVFSAADDLAAEPRKAIFNFNKNAIASDLGQLSSISDKKKKLLFLEDLLRKVEEVGLEIREAGGFLRGVSDQLQKQKYKLDAAG